ncbi:MAG: UDP-3-O-[3-hydroxymyristoyl] glucosamine N-acyltransferase [Arenicella sp.]
MDYYIKMKLKQTTTLSELAKLLQCDFKGDPNLAISGVNEIHMVEGGDVVFVDHPKYYKKALESAADVILIDQDIPFPEGKGIIISSAPFDDFNKITKLQSPFKAWSKEINAKSGIHESVIIGPNVSIGFNVEIGAGSIIHAGAVIGDNTRIGKETIIGPNAVIGFDAFYYKKKQNGFHKMHSCGGTILADRVEIGALTTIDRGVTSFTKIGAGTKIDNQVHVGHDTQIGENCLFAANVGIAGCVVIEDNVTLWGQVGVVSDITIGEGAVVYGQSGVGRSLEGGKSYLGSPCEESRRKFKELAALKKLPFILESL